MLRVHVDNPDGPPQDHTFTKPEVMIGRRPDNDLVLPGKDVSGSHACLQVEDGRVMLYDLRSTNGTFINGQQIPAPAELGPDDEVTISVFSLRVALTNPQANPPEPPVETLDDADLEPAPNDDLDGPPLARSPFSDQTPADFDADAPPLVVRPRVAAAASSPLRRIVPIDPTPPPVAPLSPVAPLPDFQTPATPSNLAQAWQDPTVRRIFLIGLTRVEVERDGVRLPMSLSFASVDDLSAQLSAICGHPVRFTTPEHVLADGTVIQATETSEHGPYVVLTRPRVRCLVGLGALVQEHMLPPAAAELLSACTRARLPVLLAALPGAAAGALLTALLGTSSGPSAYVRGLPTPIPTPRGCTSFDAGHGEGRMAAAVRLALTGELQTLGIDEPEAAALDECAWAVADGCGLVVGLRAESLQHALRRGRVAGADGPAIPYALVALLARVQSGRSSLQWLGELSPGDGPNNVHELFTTDRRGELIATAVPRLLASLTERGIHLADTLFTPA